MFSDQNVLVVTICVLVGLLIWGRWRYDAVTLVALAALVLFEVETSEVVESVDENTTEISLASFANNDLDFFE